METPPDPVSTAPLDWEGCDNARDVGGYPTADGRRVRAGALLRSDNLCRLTERGRARLLAAGVRAIVDLRNVEEHDIDPPPYGANTAPDAVPLYLSLPLFDLDNQETLARLRWTRARYGANYCALLDGFRRSAAAIFGAVADAPAGGVLVHCHAGKDRTGVVVAVLLALAGVPTATIVADYAASQPALWARWEVDRLAAPTLAPPHAPPEAMEELLDWLEREHGGAAGYLRAIGLSDDQIGRLRERLLD
jgi:protein-tyrosine phosphatase